MIGLAEDNSLLSFEVFQPFAPHITNFVTSRHGGFSDGTYATFNPSPYSGDDISFVRRNLTKLVAELPHHPLQLFRPRQVHGTELRVIDEPFLELPNEQQMMLLTGVDALATRIPGYCICVSTADCIPLMLYDKANDLVAVVHAGWRGTLKRIVVHTLHELHERFGTEGKNVYAGIGPGISLAAFEVGNEVYDAFSKAGFDMNAISCFSEDSNKYHIDLWQANSMQLEECGVPHEQIELSGICTYTQYEDFFSARRLGKESGRILSGMMINLE
jgi:YfiH family protein